MKHLHKLTMAGALLAVVLGSVFCRFQTQAKAEEEAQPSSDKWVQIQDNNKKMLDDLATIQENLQFAHARAMQGAHKP